MTTQEWHTRYTDARSQFPSESFIANCPEPQLRLIESQLLLKRDTADGPEFEAIEAVLLAIFAKLPLFE